MEDDPSCNFIYQQILDDQYDVRYFCTLADFKSEVLTSSTKPNIIIADITLPDGNFLSLLSESDLKVIRDLNFIVVSSIEDLNVLQACFDEGALDYLIKPFHKNQLLIKVQKSFEDMKKRIVERKVLDVDLNQESFDALTLKERKILKVFIDAQEKGVSRKEMCGKIWPFVHVHPKTLDVHLYNLRKKIDTYGWQIIFDGRNSWFLKQSGGVALQNHIDFFQNEGLRG